MKLILHLSLFPLKITDLFDRIVDRGVKLDEVRASEVLGSLLDAIAYLHERQIVHRDLKVSFIVCAREVDICAREVDTSSSSNSTPTHIHQHT